MLAELRRTGREQGDEGSADWDGCDMTGWDVAAVAGGVAAAVSVTILLARLLVAVGSLDRTTRELVRVIEDVRREAARPETVPLGNGAADAQGSVGLVATGGSDGSGGSGRSGRSGRRANGRAELAGAPPMSGRLDVGVRLSDLGLVSPVIKARALGRGTSQAARQLRQRRGR